MNELTIVNLTDTLIRIYPDEYSDISLPVKKSDMEKFIQRCVPFPPSGRAKSEIYRDDESVKATIKGGSKKSVRLSYTHIGIVSGLPEPKEDTIYIVSQLTYNAIFHLRKDVYMIDKPIRADGGGVIACRGFSRCVYDKDNKQLDSIDKLLKKLFAKSKADDEFTSEIANAIILLNEYRKK